MIKRIGWSLMSNGYEPSHARPPHTARSAEGGGRPKGLPPPGIYPIEGGPEVSWFTWDARSGCALLTLLQGLVQDDPCRHGNVQRTDGAGHGDLHQLVCHP